MLELHVKFLATLYTALLMSAIAGLLFFGGFKMHKQKKFQGKAISAQMVDISQIQRKNKPTKKTSQPVKKQPPPVKKTEPKKVEVKKSEIKKPDVKKAVTPQPKIDTAKRDKAKQEEIERRKKLEEIRKKRIEAEQRAQKEAEYLEQLNQKILEEDAIVAPVTSTQKGTDEISESDKMMAMYQAAVISAVTRQWTRPPTSNPDLLCHVKVRQIPGGGVVDATISSPCNASALVKKSIIDAIKKADPLPYKGFEGVFSRNATFIFDPKE